MTSAKKKDSFEGDLEKLEEIVAALEEGGLSLDDALKQFEEGVKLSRKCEKALSDAEKKIELLTVNSDGEMETETFDPENPEGASAKRPASKKKESAKMADDEYLDDYDEHDDDELF